MSIFTSKSKAILPRRRIMSVPAAMVAIAVVGCGSSVNEPTSASLERGSLTSPSPVIQWTEPADYAFTLDSKCGERSLLGLFRVTVEGGDVTAVEGLDHTAELLIREPDLRDEVPSLAGLLQEVEAAKTSGADVADVTTDPLDGHPTQVMIDHDEQAIDDEACYSISDYVPSS